MKCIAVGLCLFGVVHAPVEFTRDDISIVDQHGLPIGKERNAPVGGNAVYRRRQIACIKLLHRVPGIFRPERGVRSYPEFFVSETEHGIIISNKCWPILQLIGISPELDRGRMAIVVYAWLVSC